MAKGKRSTNSAVSTNDFPSEQEIEGAIKVLTAFHSATRKLIRAVDRAGLSFDSASVAKFPSNYTKTARKATRKRARGTSGYSQDKMIAAMRGQGPQTVASIADNMGDNSKEMRQNVSVALQRLKGQGKVVRHSATGGQSHGTWELVA